MQFSFLLIMIYELQNFSVSSLFAFMITWASATSGMSLIQPLVKPLPDLEKKHSAEQEVQSKLNIPRVTCEWLLSLSRSKRNFQKRNNAIPTESSRLLLSYAVCNLSSLRISLTGEYSLR